MLRRRTCAPAYAAAALLLACVPASAADGFRPEARAPDLEIPPAILWPPLVPPPRETDRPCGCRDSCELRAGHLRGEWRECLAPNPLADVGDAVLKGPEAILDGALSLVDALFPRSGSYDWEEEDRKAITSRFLEWEIVPRRGRISLDFMGSLVDRERRFFLDFEDSHLFTPSYEFRLEDVDYEDLRYEQQKAVLDAIRKAYLMKYRFRPEERIREDAFGFRGWGGVDFLVLPPVMAGYLYLRGLERKFSVGGMELTVRVEPLSRWTGDEEDLRAGAGLELRVRGFPVALIASAGKYGGAAELDFVGIGTSLGMVRKALRIRSGED